MADVFDKKKRSEIMSAVPHSDTKPEVKLRKALWHLGYRYRKNYRKLPGSPDIVLTKYRIAIFVDGGFWHGKDFYESEEIGKRSLKEKISKGNNPEYWMKKINRNIERDASVDAELKGAGWTVLRFWDTDVNKNLNGCIKAVKECIFEKGISHK